MQNEHSGEENSWRLSDLTLSRESRLLSSNGGVIHVRWPSEVVGTESRAVDGFGEPSYDTYFPSDAYPSGYE